MKKDNVTDIKDAKTKKEKSKTNTKSKISKKSFIFILIAIICCAVGIFATNLNPTVSDTPVEFEVLDESVLTRDIFKEWVSANANKKGEYTKEDGDYVYAMISYGETTKPGVGICIEEVKGSKNVEVVYSIIESNDERQTEKYTPKMILKLPNTNGKVVFKQVQSE